MKVVYARQPFPEAWSAAIFLAGPTPRASRPVPSWRPDAITILQELGYTGTVFVPEPEDSAWEKGYEAQVGWELEAMHLADIILFWVPRELERMPAFTTNVEFGHWVSSHKCVLGHPEHAPKTQYLDVLYREITGLEPLLSLRAALEESLQRIGSGAPRRGGERYVPLLLWRTEMLQSWYRSLLGAGNRLDEARVRWVFYLPSYGAVFAVVLWVDVWVQSEGRHKRNEWIFGRSDICSVVLWHRSEGAALLDTSVVLVREFRSPGRTNDGFVHELPGGSSAEGGPSLAQIAADEVAEETGLRVTQDRLTPIGSRQVAATVSTHHARVFACALSQDEMQTLRARAQSRESLGNADDTERTTVEVATLRELLLSERSDWSTLGMVARALLDAG